MRKPIFTPEQKLARKREADRRWRAANPEKARESARRYRAANPDKAREAMRDWRLANRERTLAIQRRSNLWRAHGMRPEDFAQMHKAQQGLCYLCRDPLPDDSLHVHVDHDHRCPHPKNKSCGYCRRGLACGRCNNLIGLADDDPQRLRRIAGNLETAIVDVARRLADRSEQAELFEPTGS
jgi:Recombination endonuclease VII